MTLDIVIPTKGRHDDLRVALTVLREQLHEAVDLPLRVGICISDSSERGLPIVSEFPDLPITYLHSPGIPKFVDNLRQAISLSRADYLWLMGDDDIILPQSLQTLREALKTNPTMIHMNAIIRDKIIDSQGPMIPSPPDQSGNPPISLLRSIDELTYLSCLIFSRDIANDPSALSQAHSSEVASHLRFIDIAFRRGPTVCIDEPMVMIEKNEQVVSEWNGNWSVLFGYEMPRLRDAFLQLKSPLLARNSAQVFTEVRMHALLCVFRGTYPFLAKEAALFKHSSFLVKLIKRILYFVSCPKWVRVCLLCVGTYFDPRCRQFSVG
jgi:glycosyltransferase involved in cell wall biosynthesis